MQTLASFVCGRWHEGAGDQQPLHDPTTEAQIGQCSSSGIDFAAAVRHAREVGGPALRALDFAARGAALKALSAAVHGIRDELIELSGRNGGSTRGDAKFDIDGATGTLAAYAALGDQLGKEMGAGRHLPDGDGVQLGRSPRFGGQHMWVSRPGVAVHVNAFNFPAWGMGEKMACALLAGVPVIEKAGTPSALVAWRMAKAIADAGILPPGAFQFVAGGAGDLLDHLRPMDCLAFTGSSRTGLVLKGHPNLLEHNVRVNLEADSLNAAVVGPDVEVGSDTFGLFLTNVVTDMTQKAGQKCTAVRRIFVPRPRVDDVVAALVERLGAIKVGDPAAADTRMGPLASARQLADVRAGIGRLLEHGKAACGGPDKVFDRGYFVAPSLVVMDRPDVEVVHAEEVFGPCASVLPYDDADVERLIELVNLGRGGLVVSLYSNDREFTERVAFGIAPWHGRLWLGSDRVADQALAPGMVLPQTIHGGPGRAGGGEELGGLRGLQLYMQRIAVQGFHGTVSKSFGRPQGATSGA
ncbi:MAG: 3,4-dehydroadipyl-CoA semialdehyde dehydrogenase [Planctomycetota bacterium]